MAQEKYHSLYLCYQPLLILVLNQEDLERYFWVDKGIAESSPTPNEGQFANSEI